MVYIIEQRHIAAGAGITVLTLVILWSITIGGPVYGVKINEEPFFAECGVSSCYDIRNISHNFTNEICFPRNRIAAQFPAEASEVSGRYWGNVTRQRDVYGWVEKSYTCAFSFNYTLNPNMSWCYQTVNSSSVILFQHNFSRGSIPQKRVWWRDWEVVGSEDYIAQDWKPIPSQICLQPNRNYTIRTDFDVPPNSEGKYNVTIRLPDSMGGDLFLLDPWWDVTAPYRYRLYGYTNSTMGDPTNSTSGFNSTSWVYYANSSSSYTNMTLYCNDSTDIEGVVDSNNVEAFWFQTLPAINWGTANTSIAKQNFTFWYPLDNGDPLYIWDFTNAKKGTIAGPLDQEVSGVYGKAVDFPAAGGTHIVTPIHDYRRPGYMDLVPNMTFSMWVKRNSSAEASTLIGFKDGATDQLLIDFYGAIHPYVYLRANGSIELNCGDRNMDDGNWHHLLVTINQKTITANAYIDGDLKCTVTGTDDTTLKASTNPLWIGEKTDGSQDYLGVLDDVRYYWSWTDAHMAEAIFNSSNLTSGYQTRMGPKEGLPVKIEWNWTQINSTIILNSARGICINATQNVNCTLHFNGTNVANSTSNTDICFYRDGMVNGNFSRVNVTCDSIGDFEANTTQAWLNVSAPEAEFDVVIIDNDYGFTAPEFYPSSWAAVNVSPLGQVDRNETNFCLAKKATYASLSLDAAHNATAAVDGDLATYWRTGAEGSLWTIRRNGSQANYTKSDGNWQNIPKLHDNNWGTWGDSISGSSFFWWYFYLNTTSATTARIHYKDEGTEGDLNLPANCFSGLPNITILAESYQSGSNKLIRWYCNGTAGTQILRQVSGIDLIYEMNLSYTYSKIPTEAVWQVDLGKTVHNIDYFRYYTKSNETACLFFNVSYSLDNTTWTRPVWGWGQRCDNESAGNNTAQTLNPVALFSARYIRLDYEAQLGVNNTYASNYQGGLSELEVYQGGRGIFNVTTNMPMGLKMKLNDTTHNMTLYASGIYNFTDASYRRILSTSYQPILNFSTQGFIWLWASFNGTVNSTFDWGYDFEVIS